MPQVKILLFDIGGLFASTSLDIGTLEKSPSSTEIDGHFLVFFTNLVFGNFDSNNTRREVFAKDSNLIGGGLK